MHAEQSDGVEFVTPVPEGHAEDDQGPPIEIERFDVAKLGSVLKAHRLGLGLSLRRAAEAAHVSFSTFTRVESGSQPDLASFTALCAWMGLPPSRFFVPVAERIVDPMDEVVFHLTNDPRLSPSASAKMSSLLRDMYDSLARTAEPQGQVVACHLRAATTLRPGVSDRLSSLLLDMHRSLETRVADGSL